MPPPTAAPVLFDAVLAPHRSLGRRGFAWLIGAFACASGAIGLGFYLIGAWPVVGFVGLDVVLLWGALKLSYFSARRTERLRLSAEALTVHRVDPWGRADDVSFAPPHWLRVEIDDPPRHESRLVIASHGRGITVGSFLQPEERFAVATALRRALDTLRRTYSPSTSIME